VTAPPVSVSVSVLAGAPVGGAADAGGGAAGAGVWAGMPAVGLGVGEPGTGDSEVGEKGTGDGDAVAGGVGEGLAGAALVGSGATGPGVEVGTAWLGAVGLGDAWLGAAWLGAVWLGAAGLGVVEPGMAGSGVGQSMAIELVGAVVVVPGAGVTSGLTAGLTAGLTGAPAVTAFTTFTAGAGRADALAPAGAAHAAVPASRDTPTAAATSRPTADGAIRGSSRRARRPERPGSRAIRPTARTTAAQPTRSQAISPAVVTRTEATAASGAGAVTGADPDTAAQSWPGGGSCVTRTASPPTHSSMVRSADHCFAVESLRLTSFAMA
jgi:hypothetical protein